MSKWFIGGLIFCIAIVVLYYSIKGFTESDPGDEQIEHEDEYDEDEDYEDDEDDEDEDDEDEDECDEGWASELQEMNQERIIESAMSQPMVVFDRTRERIHTDSGPVYLSAEEFDAAHHKSQHPELYTPHGDWIAIELGKLESWVEVENRKRYQFMRAYVQNVMEVDWELSLIA